MPPENSIDALIARYHGRGILVDSNLLVLDVIGRSDPRLIGKHKRTEKYTTEDFELLEEILAHFLTVVTTPHILTEVSNLSGKGFRAALGERIQLLEEKQCASSSAAADSAFRQLGLTDSAIISVCTGSFLVLTEDAELAHVLEHRGADVINFNHIRTWFWS